MKSLSRVRPSGTPGLQPSRLLRPWDFPGKSTGVGCHCLLRAIRMAIIKTTRNSKCWKGCGEKEAHRLPRPWDSPGKNTGVGCHFLPQCVKVKSESEVAQSCLTPSDPMDCSPPGSSVPGILQARVLEWGAIAFSLQLSLNPGK